MKQNYDVIAVGMINFDINVKTFDPHGLVNKVSNVEEIALGFGGDAQNCAFTMARLGLKTAICGAVGNDMAGTICLNAQSAAGIDTSMVCKKASQTGTAVQLFQTAEASVLNCSGANAEFCTEDIPERLYGAAKVASLHSFFGCGSVGADFLEKARRSGMITVADTTSLTRDDCLDDIAPALKHLDYFVPSYNEAKALAGLEQPEEIAKKFLRMGVKNVIIKLGDQGCYVCSDLEKALVKGYNIKNIVDTTGCGDNFVAGFITGLVKGMSMRASAALANAAGAINATQLGSNRAVQSYAQLRKFMEENKGEL